MLLKTTLATSLITLAGLAHAQMTPTGLWKTSDDDSKKEKKDAKLLSDASMIFSIHSLGRQPSVR